MDVHTCVSSSIHTYIHNHLLYWLGPSDKKAAPAGRGPSYRGMKRMVSAAYLVAWGHCKNQQKPVVRPCSWGAHFVFSVSSSVFFLSSSIFFLSCLWHLILSSLLALLLSFQLKEFSRSKSFGYRKRRLKAGEYLISTRASASWSSVLFCLIFLMFSSLLICHPSFYPSTCL